MKLPKCCAKIVWSLSILCLCVSQGLSFEHFITTKDGKLYDGDHEFRFISWNIPNLNFVEDEMAFEKKHAFRLPNKYELTDAMESVKQLGGQVIRTYTIPVLRKSDTPDIPRYVLGPGKFDETSFKCMDTMLAVANEAGIRLIIPLLNNWKWMGGVPQYAEFRGKDSKDFWSDPQLIADFKKTIDFVLNRNNTVTGIKYKDDQAILCWETGNELYSPQQWTTEICKYIKSIDQNHLVMDGFHANRLKQESIDDPYVDIVTTHHYESHAGELLHNVRENINLNNGKKVYILGEFGFLSTSSLTKILDEIIAKDIAGSLIWSLRSHRREGGFYWHSEPLGMGLYKAYHFLGFPSGNEYDEINIMRMMRQKAFQIRGLAEPGPKIPESPTLLPIIDVAKINWQGSVGTSVYDIERSLSLQGPWQKIGYNISDAKYQYADLFSDETAIPGQEYYYRIIAKNSAGDSAPSNICGPVKCQNYCLIDHMENFGSFYDAQGKYEIRTDNDRIFKEDMSRLAMERDGELVYFVAENIQTAKIYSFSADQKKVMEFYLSRDGQNYQAVEAKTQNYSFGKGDYNYQNPILYTITNKTGHNKYLKIRFCKAAQISKIEIKYGNENN